MYKVEVTQTIIKLAVERFADKEKYEQGIQLGAALIVHDIRTGEDGFTGEKLSVPKLDFPEIVWSQLILSVLFALNGSFCKSVY